MLDLSNEQEQRDFVPGPVPGGSIVMVRMEVLEPAEERQHPQNRFVSRAPSGLLQIYCQFTVIHGTYQGVRWRQNITLPQGSQSIRLAEKQITACNIGGAMLKAMCLAARRNPRLRDVTELTGLCFPVRVKINQRPVEKDDGRVFWNNEISIIITPEKEAYASVCNGGEIIMKNGPVTGSGGDAGSGKRSSHDDGDGWPSPSEDPMTDNVPF